jgi:hypothetical protein
LRRSIMTAGVAMVNHGMKEEYVQANIYVLEGHAPPRGGFQRKLTLS